MSCLIVDFYLDTLDLDPTNPAFVPGQPTASHHPRRWIETGTSENKVAKIRLIRKAVNWLEIERRKRLNPRMGSQGAMWERERSPSAKPFLVSPVSRIMLLLGPKHP